MANYGLADGPQLVAQAVPFGLRLFPSSLSTIADPKVGLRYVAGGRDFIPRNHGMCAVALLPIKIWKLLLEFAQLG
jgi:hypothetical protein